MVSASTAPVIAARKYTIAEGLIGGALINGILNAVLGYLLIPMDELPMFGVPGVAADIFGMAFGIAFGTELLLAPQLRKRSAAGRLTAGNVGPLLAAVLARWPRGGLWRRTTRLGGLSALVFAPPAVVALWLAGFDIMDRLEMTWMKGIFAAVVGGIVTPLIGLAALTDPPPDAQLALDVPSRSSS